MASSRLLSVFDEFSAKMLTQIRTGNQISALDIDVFAHKISKVDSSFISALEELLTGFRHSQSCLEQLPSTSHAIIRTLLSNNQALALFRLLIDPVKYGVFLDSHSALLGIDHFMLSKNFEAAARVACEWLRQDESFASPTATLSATLSLRAIHTFLHENMLPVLGKPEEGWTQQTLIDTETESEPTIIEWHKELEARNPTFDESFELRHPRHLLGRSLWLLLAPRTSADAATSATGLRSAAELVHEWRRRQQQSSAPSLSELAGFGLELPDEPRVELGAVPAGERAALASAFTERLARSPLGISYRLVALALWEKFERAEKMLALLAQDRSQRILFPEAAKIYKLCLESARLVLKKDEKPDPAGPPKITAEQLDLYKKKFAELEPQLAAVYREGGDSLNEAVEKLTKSAIAEFEPAARSDLEATYARWNEARERMLRAQLDRLQRQQKLDSIRERLGALLEQSEIQHYFEREQDILLSAWLAPRVTSERSRTERQVEDAHIARHLRHSKPNA